MGNDTDFSQTDAGSRQLLNALISSAVDAIIVIDSRGLVRLFSRSAETLFGYRHDEVLGRNVKMLMPQPYRAEHDGYIQAYETTGRRRIIGIGREVRVAHRDGEEFPADLAVGEARIDGERMYVGIIRDLRMRTHLETMLEQERRRAERVFDLVEVVIFGVDHEGRVLIANRQAADLLGQHDDPIGKPLQDWIEGDDQQRVSALLSEMFRQRPTSPWPAEYRIRSEAGGDRYLAWQHQFVPSSETGEADLVLCTGVDITETHRMARLLRTSEEQLRLTFEQAPVGIARLDLSGTILEANRTLGEMLAAGNDALVGVPFSRMLDGARREQFVRSLDTLANRDSDHLAQECDLGWEASAIKARLFMGMIRDADDQPMGFLVQIEDRSEQAAAETEIDHLRNRLAHVQRLSVMGEMAAGIAHEINQPLGAIATFSDGAQRMLASVPPRLEDVRYGLEQIGEQARRAGDVVGRMRAMAKDQEITHEAADINRLISDLISLAELEARNLGAPLILDLEQGLAQAMVDTVQIQQVILNLIRNSLEAMATRSQASRGVTISTRQRRNELLVCVADYGVGIGEDFQRRVFEPFYSSKPTGTGMGLSICSTIVRAHEGKLWHEPNEPEGSRFLFTLPLVSNNEAETGQT